MPNYFKLDSNVDLSYTDSEGNEQIVKDAIQVISGTDGSETTPNTDGIIDDYTSVSDLTSSTSISGRGVVYGETGDIIATKGNLIFRDSEGNVLGLNSIKYNNIKEDTLNNVFLRDQSLSDKTEGTKDYVSVNQLLESAKQSVLAPGNGNVVQLNQKKVTDTDTLEMLTVPLSANNNILIKCKVIVDSDAIITLSDTTISGGNVELTKTKVTNSNTPAYITYSGSLEQVDQENTYDVSKTAVYNNFHKRFFLSSRQDGDTYDSDSPHTLTLSSTVPFRLGYMNILVSDEKVQDTLIGGSIILNNQDSHVLQFDDALEDSNYVISSLVSSEPVGIWYDSKKSSGFNINLDRKFTGKIFWEVVR